MIHRILSSSVAFLFLVLMWATTASAQLDCLGVDGGPALPGTLCDDGNPFTVNDEWGADCICRGWCPNLGVGAFVGGPCDAGPGVVNAQINEQCVCVGDNAEDCEGVPGGSALPGTPCDDGDPNTTGEVWTADCICMVINDCLGEPFGDNMPGSPCNDGDPNTFFDQWTSDCVCEGGPNVISGQVFLDADQDGVFGVGDLPIMNRTIQLGVNGPFASSGPTGAFSFNVSSGMYMLAAHSGSLDTMGMDPVLVEFSGFEQVSSGNDIAMFANTDMVDLSVSLVVATARPGFSTGITVMCKNLGPLLADGALTVTFDPQQVHVTNTLGGVVAGNSVTWELPIMQLGQVITRHLTVQTPSSIPIGTGLIYGASVEATAPDGVPENNVVILHETVLASYDPNDKLVTPASLTPQEVGDGKPIQYTIRFQNTGTYLAETVRIEDQLSEDLDLSTFEFLGSSHPCTWSIENGMLEFLFEEIMLPDSNSNEPESHGFVLFRITPNSDLQLGDVVENIAAIYFDFNEPIITEPAVFTVDDVSSISITGSDDIRIWPNPSTGMVSIEFSGSNGELVVLDLMGRPVHRQRITGGTTSMDLSGLATGNYVVRIDAPDATYRSRFMKK